MPLKPLFHKQETLYPCISASPPRRRRSVNHEWSASDLSIGWSHTQRIAEGARTRRLLRWHFATWHPRSTARRDTAHSQSESSESEPGEARPRLLWPGEFWFGYPGQNLRKEVEEPGTGPLENPKRKAPEFARNGSFLVFRRLRQDVGTFHRFLQSLTARFQVPPELVSTRLVGRWASGTPVVVTPNQDDPALAEHGIICGWRQEVSVVKGQGSGLANPPSPPFAKGEMEHTTEN
jgi:hypothetical protein